MYNVRIYNFVSHCGAYKILQAKTSRYCKVQSLYQRRIKSLANEGSALDIIVGAALCQPIDRPHLPWQQPNGSAAA